MKLLVTQDEPLVMTGQSQSRAVYPSHISLFAQLLKCDISSKLFCAVPLRNKITTTSYYKSFYPILIYHLEGLKNKIIPIHKLDSFLLCFYSHRWTGLDEHHFYLFFSPFSFCQPLLLGWISSENKIRMLSYNFPSACKIYCGCEKQRTQADE